MAIEESKQGLSDDEIELRRRKKLEDEEARLKKQQKEQEELAKQITQGLASSANIPAVSRLLCKIDPGLTSAIEQGDMHGMTPENFATHPFTQALLKNPNVSAFANAFAKEMMNAKKEGKLEGELGGQAAAMLDSYVAANPIQTPTGLQGKLQAQLSPSRMQGKLAAKATMLAIGIADKLIKTLGPDAPSANQKQSTSSTSQNQSTSSSSSAGSTKKTSSPFGAMRPTPFNSGGGGGGGKK